MKRDNQVNIDLQEELYKGICANTKASSFALLLNIIVINIAFYQNIDLVVLSVWTFIITLLLILRSIDPAAYTNKTSKKTISQLAIRFQVLSLLIASFVSIGIIYITPINLPFHQAFLAMIVAGLSAGAVMALSYYQNLLRAYLLILIVPFAAFILFQGSKVHILISLLMFLFLVMLMMFSKRFYENISELIISKNEIYFQAHYDHITGLINRTTLYDRLSLEIIKLKRSKNYSALLFIDLDDFKQINDSLGHHAGDISLKLFTKRISSVIREEDTFARLGGDEFVILLSHLSSDSEQASEISMNLSEKIHTSLKDTFVVENTKLSMSASIGIEIISPEGIDMQEVIKNADTAMYRAKKSGKNQTVLFQKS